MGTSAARSSLYLAIGNVASKVIAGVGQAMFGVLLGPDAFGTYAFVIGIVTIANIFRDGGISDHLVRLGPRVDTRVTNEALAGAIATNSLAALALAGVAQLVGLRPEHAEVGTLLVVAAAAMPLGSHFGVAVGVLQSRCEFKKAALLFFVQAAVQVLSALALAALWHSAMALVLGLVISAAASSLVGVRLARINVWPGTNGWARGMTMIHQSKWLMAGSLGTALVTGGDYLGLGLSWTNALLGIYFFGYQIPAQLGGVASSVGQVLLASLPRATTAEARQQLLMSGTSALGYIVAPLCFCVVLVLPLAERLIWGDRWHDAVVVGQILAALFPLRLLLAVARSTRIAAGEYRRWTVHIGVAGAGLFAVSSASGRLTTDPAVVAGIIGGFLACTVAAMTCSALRTQGISYVRALRVVLEPYALCALLAIPPLALTQLVTGDVIAPSIVAALAGLAIYGALVGVTVRSLNPQVWHRIRAVASAPFAQKSAAADVDGAVTPRVNEALRK
ncbi:oligosaccharide flippase family protein [Krasilnikovia sp. MM14-A1259]|uniref:oligosaccharide flippase family protein n=1 Tax=Krasilnikovia sp. MM14-A1259 TaxID=3373539 RepID=UPI003809FDB4